MAKCVYVNCPTPTLKGAPTCASHAIMDMEEMVQTYLLHVPDLLNKGWHDDKGRYICLTVRHPDAT